MSRVKFRRITTLPQRFPPECSVRRKPAEPASTQRGVSMDMALVIEKAVAEMMQLRSQISQWMDEYEAGEPTPQSEDLCGSIRADLSFDAVALTEVAMCLQSTAGSHQWRKQRRLLRHYTTRSCGISLCK